MGRPQTPGDRGALRAAALVAALCLLLAGCSSGTARAHAGGEPSAARVGLDTRQAPRPKAALRRVIVGRSVEGRPIIAYEVGDPGAPRKVLVVGCLHGDERHGEAITRRLRARTPPAGTTWWLIDRANPDGCRAGTRQNAHGVDLNRNSPWHWRPLDPPGGTYYAGPRALSEPESLAINRLVRRLHPALSIWYHQHAALVDSSSGGSLAVERRYARRVRLPLRGYGRVPGSITTWQDTTFRRSTAFVVELPRRALSRADVARHVAALSAVTSGP
jgi:protein MpaA